jgi:hypothetical protein
MSQRTGETETEKQQVVDFNEARAQKLDEKRRKAERIFFKNLLSVYCVTGNTHMRPVELVEVSEDGCSFQVPYDDERPWPSNTDVPIRLYFSQDTYISVMMRIQNSRPSIDAGQKFMRFGCAVDKETSTYQAYVQFVRFLKLYSEHAHKDKGDVTVFYL